MKKKTLNILHSIGFKFVLCFVVSILFIILLGVLCYNGASNALRHTIETNTTDTIHTMASYFDLGLSSAQSEASKIIENENIYKYYRGAMKNRPPYEYMLYRTNFNTVTSAVKSNEFIAGITVLSSYGKGISSQGTVPEGYYQDFVASVGSADYSKGKWVSSHSALDSALGMTQDKYAASLIQKFSVFDGYTIVDIDMKAIKNQLQALEIDEAQIAFISADGREIAADDAIDFKFAEQEFYSQAQANTDSALSYVKHNGKSHMFILSPIGDTGFSIACLIPESAVLKEISSIKGFTIMVVLISIICVALLGMAMVVHTNMASRKIITVLEKASSGDLSNHIKVRGKDEFAIISNSINDMIGSMKQIIDQTSLVSNEVFSSSFEMSENTDKFIQFSKTISKNMEDIQDGVTIQDNSSSECYDRISKLSDRINALIKNSNTIQTLATETREYADNGINILGDLNEKSKNTSEITKNISDDVEVLMSESNAIENVIAVIHNIANQTKLLALNSSIEAAKAGEVGRGFAVVATEIRDLAESSVSSVAEITKIIHNIQAQTMQTAKTAKRASDIVNSQEAILTEVTDAFTKISESVIILADNLNSVANDISLMDDDKKAALKAIENIAQVSSETSRNVSSMQSIIRTQSQLMNSLSSTSDNMKTDAANLNDTISRFNVETEE